MNEHLPVVAHFKEGTIKKGYTKSFAFFREVFDFTEVNPRTEEDIEKVMIRLEDLKALFYVKEFEGNPDYQPRNDVERHGFGDRVEVTFHDNETLVGYTPNYREDNNGFILYPADPGSNNQIVAVIRSSIQSVKTEKKHSYFNL